MNDTLTCPICQNKLRSIKTPNKRLYWIGKTSNYIERVCSRGINHSLQFFTDEKTDQVDMLKLSLNPNYSRHLEIDFCNQKCRIRNIKDGTFEHIDIPRLIEPDFPALAKLKETISIFMVFS